MTAKSGRSYLPYMADDGAGFDTAPGMIISAYDAEVLKRTINDPNWSGYDSGKGQSNVIADIDWGWVLSCRPPFVVRSGRRGLA